MNQLATRVPMAKSKRNDQTAKIDAEILRRARIVAEFEEVTLAEYLSGKLRPVVTADYERHIKAAGKSLDAKGAKKPEPPER